MPQQSMTAQMYTVRQASAQDFPGTLKRVAQLGFTHVELAGLFGFSALEVRQFLQEVGLKCLSAHVPLTELRQNLAEIIETYTTLEAGYIICPWLPPEERSDTAGYKALGAELNKMGELCQTNGLQLCYHHHDFELVQFDGKYALDIILDESDPKNVQLEADTYWLKFGGVDPVTYLKRRSGRVPLLHLKDMTQTSPPTFAEVGTGTLDWSQIFEAAAACGVQWYIVEQDKCAGDPFESLRISMENLSRMGFR